RLHPAAGALAARLALGLQVRDTLDSLNRTVNAMLVARRGLSPAKRAQLDRDLGSAVQLDIHSSEGDLLHETRLRDHLAFLMNELDTAYDKPTAAEYQTYGELRDQAAALDDRWKTLSSR
ncbi:MAG: hypothetical protein M3126_09295, partial [Candidatus Eremiobacteraeota bacterium]|nr:hypothetical protein [Candidatus Eremiobacteraeota bacterium]